MEKCMHGARVAGATCSIGSPPCTEVSLPQEARARRVPSLTTICSLAACVCVCLCPSSTRGEEATALAAARRVGGCGGYVAAQSILDSVLYVMCSDSAWRRAIRSDGTRRDERGRGWHGMRWAAAYNLKINEIDSGQMIRFRSLPMT